MSTLTLNGTGRGKRFTLFGSMGPNPWKVAMLLHELGFGNDYDLEIIPGGEPSPHKSPAYTKYNPNGRTPAFVDHSNNDFVIWESGAILYYIIEKYDPEHKVSFEKLEEKATAMQYLMYQMSGQGPYYGQAFWFFAYHPEQIKSAQDRYVNEIKRVLGVLNTILEGKDWLVSNKYSYVDIAFAPWHMAIDFMAENKVPELKDWREKFPNVGRWHDAVLARPAVKEALETKAKALGQK